MSLVVHGVEVVLDGHRILRGVDAAFEPGTFTGLIGPNGSGKTTLLTVLTGLRRPTAGSVLLDGAPLGALPPRRRARRIALVEQRIGTTLDLSVREVVELGRAPHRGRWGRDDGRAVTTAMAATSIAGLGDRSWLSLSGGEQQRVQLARALAQQPELLLLDEPTNHLDPRHQLDLLGVVRDQRLTTIAALHDLNLAAAFCDRLLVLDGGRVVADGTVEQVLSADLLLTVYGVRASVERHPRTDRPLVVFDAVPRPGEAAS